MGLTIHFSIAAPAEWPIEIVRVKLEAARQFAKTLPVVAVSELAEFRDEDADYQHVRAAGLEKSDPFFWSKIQAQRSIVNPWQPGSYASQSPSHMLVVSIDVASGCEELNIGICQFPRHLWKADLDSRSKPAWSLVFEKRNHYPASRKLMRAFLKRWRLKKLPPSQPNVWSRYRFGGTETACYMTANCRAKATIQKGKYLSHRKGYRGTFGLLTIEDRMQDELYFKYMGTAKEAEKIFGCKDFQTDLERMGQPYITPAASGIWSSFCKSQYANSGLGGTANFIKAHLSVLAVLEHLQGLGFDVKVQDEGGFWEHRNIELLAKTVGEWDAGLAALFGVIRDVASTVGAIVETALDNRVDFEHLEMKGQRQITDLLKKLSPKPHKRSLK